MSPWLEIRLYDAFPLLFAEYTLPREVSPMGWGCACGDGWFLRLWRLSTEQHELIQQEPAVERAVYRAGQVKEKLGGLRFYMHRNASLYAGHARSISARRNRESHRLRHLRCVARQRCCCGDQACGARAVWPTRSWPAPIPDLALSHDRSNSICLLYLLTRYFAAQLPLTRRRMTTHDDA